MFSSKALRHNRHPTPKGVNPIPSFLHKFLTELSTSQSFRNELDKQIDELKNYISNEMGIVAMRDGNQIEKQIGWDGLLESLSGTHACVQILEKIFKKFFESDLSENNILLNMLLDYDKKFLLHEWIEDWEKHTISPDIEIYLYLEQFYKSKVSDGNSLENNKAAEPHGNAVNKIKLKYDPLGKTSDKKSASHNMDFERSKFVYYMFLLPEFTKEEILKKYAPVHSPTFLCSLAKGATCGFNSDSVKQAFLQNAAKGFLFGVANTVKFGVAVVPGSLYGVANGLFNTVTRKHFSKQKKLELFNNLKIVVSGDNPFNDLQAIVDAIIENYKPSYHASESSLQLFEFLQTKNSDYRNSQASILNKTEIAKSMWGEILCYMTEQKTNNNGKKLYCLIANQVNELAEKPNKKPILTNVSST